MADEVAAVVSDEARDDLTDLENAVGRYALSDSEVRRVIHELRRLRSEREEVAARVRTEGRQRIAREFPSLGILAGREHDSPTGQWARGAVWMLDLLAPERTAGSTVPVAIPSQGTCKHGHAHPHLADECPGPVATPTEPCTSHCGKPVDQTCAQWGCRNAAEPAEQGG